MGTSLRIVFSRLLVFWIMSSPLSFFSRKSLRRSCHKEKTWHCIYTEWLRIMAVSLVLALTLNYWHHNISYVYSLVPRQPGSTQYFNAGHWKEGMWSHHPCTIMYFEHGTADGTAWPNLNGNDKHSARINWHRLRLPPNSLRVGNSVSP